VFPDTTYVLPLRRAAVVADDRDLTAYLSWLASRMHVIVVDGSPAEVYSHHQQVWGNLVSHLRLVSSTPNGKVAGVCDGVYAASTKYVVVADDDVRYNDATLAAVLRQLARHDAVVPQNYFQPSSWHARWDTGRSLVNRCFGRDYAGTIALTRNVFLAIGGYCGAVLFENLELARTLRAAGFSVCHATGIYVTRRPPSTRQFLAQRVRQAYDSHAQPLRFLAELSLLPVFVLTYRSRRWLGLLGATVVAMAEVGRRRSRGTDVWPGRISLWAPVWVVERSITSWVALLLGRRGGVRYHGNRLKVAAHPQGWLSCGGCPQEACVCDLPRRPLATPPTNPHVQPELIECPDCPVPVRDTAALPRRRHVHRQVCSSVGAVARPFFVAMDTSSPRWPAPTAARTGSPREQADPRQ
jgi:hypothetical protein